MDSYLLSTVWIQQRTKVNAMSSGPLVNLKDYTRKGSTLFHSEEIHTIVHDSFLLRIYTNMQVSIYVPKYWNQQKSGWCQRQVKNKMEIMKIKIEQEAEMQLTVFIILYWNLKTIKRHEPAKTKNCPWKRIKHFFSFQLNNLKDDTTQGKWRWSACRYR